ncbi:MAG: ribonuclease H-like domain-containing protein [Planctomycetota bacterium]|nr:ribonuclease H-like domain-containing protein [Planctomycetota bacterium]
MLTETYIHIDGVSLKSERRIHSGGVCDWFQFLEKPPSIHHKLYSIIKGALPESFSSLRAKNVSYFSSRLPPNEHWRFLKDFIDSAVCLDIETTGCSPYYGKVTVIGVYANERYYAFTSDEELGDAAEFLSRFKILITYNGKRFDVPFLIHKLGWGFLNDMVQVDLMYPCRKLGLKGGLKGVERELGIKRPLEISELNGYDAVKLYTQYLNGEKEAFDKLIEYNRCDVENLLKIFEAVYPKLRLEAVGHGIQNRACR